MPTLLVAAAAGLLLLAGCGDDGSSASKEPATTTSTPPAKAVGVPAELIGTYRVHLTREDLPSKPPPELAPDSSPYDWKVVIADKGGPNGGPGLSINNAKLGPLEGPALAVAGDELRLSNEECAGGENGYTFVKSTYRWKLTGRTLRLTAVKQGCPDKIAETILTTHPLTRIGG
jgi:hypothetical protein